MKIHRLFADKYKAKLLLAGFLAFPFLAEIVLQALTGYSESPIIFGALPSQYPFSLIIIYPIFFISVPYFLISNYLLALLTGVPISLLHTAKIIGPVSASDVIYILMPIYAYLVASVIVHLISLAWRKIRRQPIEPG